MGADEPRKPYGYILILRALAGAAIGLGDRPAALRVLCVMADYLDQDGQCRVGQDTIAARLRVSRQAVNRQFKHLEWAGYIMTVPRPGRATLYQLDLSEMEERVGSTWVEIRKKERRKERAAKAAEVKH